ncbi:MAG: LacI family DNA-binding transcriptional regulator [Caldilineaceae bacterium]
MSTRKVQRATITDVARLAGVSISTVSRVLNDTAPVATETVERVRDAVQKLNFIPHAAARTLAVRKTDAIGLLLPEIGSSFFIPTLRGIESAVREAGFDLFIFAGNPGANRRRDWHQPLGDHNTDGLLIFANQLDSRELSSLYQRGFPLVLLHKSSPLGVNIPSVRIDNRSGMRKLMDHLIVTHGCRRIVFLRGGEGNEDSFEREAAYREVLESNGISFAAELVESAGFTEHGGEQAVQRLLAEGIQYDAIFAGDDEAAAGALVGLRRAGLRIPQDVKLAGFDDVPIARHLNPPLTTVRVPIETASYLAARQLVRMIRNDEADVTTVLPVELVVRESCGCR